MTPPWRGTVPGQKRRLPDEAGKFSRLAVELAAERE
jgi:hypothetical protein